MPRGFKRDRAETDYRRSRKIYVDPRSFVGRSADGSLHDMLYGADKGIQRALILVRDEYTCQVCGRHLTDENAEWHHIKNKPTERCDCLHNGETRCAMWLSDCHRKEHPQPQWTPKVPREN